MTPVTPILTPARSAHELMEAGYESCPVWLKEGSTLTPEQWEPISPGGGGWILHAKGKMQDGGTRAIWVRRIAAGTPAHEIAKIRNALLTFNDVLDGLPSDPELISAQMNITGAANDLSACLSAKPPPGGEIPR